MKKKNVIKFILSIAAFFILFFFFMYEYHLSRSSVGKNIRKNVYTFIKYKKFKHFLKKHDQFLLGFRDVEIRKVVYSEMRLLIGYAKFLKIYCEAGRLWDADKNIKDIVIFTWEDSDGIDIFVELNPEKVKRLEHLANLSDEDWETTDIEKIEKAYAFAYNIKYDHWVEKRKLSEEILANKDKLGNWFCFDTINKYNKKTKLIFRWQLGYSRSKRWDFRILGPPAILPISEYMKKNLPDDRIYYFTANILGYEVDRRIGKYLYDENLLKYLLDNLEKDYIEWIISRFFISGDRKFIDIVISFLPNKDLYENTLQRYLPNNNLNNDKDKWRDWLAANKNKLYYKINKLTINTSVYTKYNNPNDVGFYAEISGIDYDSRYIIPNFKKLLEDEDTTKTVYTKPPIVQYIDERLPEIIERE